MTIKITMIFNAFKFSWAEAHYDLGHTTFNGAIPIAAELATRRQNLLGNYAVLENVRLSNVPANRLTFDLLRSFWPGEQVLSTTGPSFDQSTDSPFSSLLLSMNGSTAHKNLYLAGIPDYDVQWSPTSPNGYFPDGNFALALNAYMSLLIGTSGAGFPALGFRVTAGGFGTHANGVASQPGWNNNIGVLTEFNPNIAVGQVAVARGFRSINPRVPNLSGAYEVQAVIPPGSGNANYTTVLARTASVQDDNFQLLGTITLQAFDYEAYSDWRGVRVTHRKRGASYGKPVGKSRARR